MKKDRVTREVDKETSGQVNKLIVEEDRVTREVDKGTSRQGKKLIVKEDKVTGEQEVKAYDIWGEKGLKKARS